MADEGKSDAEDAKAAMVTWLSVVDDFRVSQYQNRLPRWVYVVAVVAIIVTKEMML